jgi:hypothetical protein
LDEHFRGVLARHWRYNRGGNLGGAQGKLGATN